MSFKGNALISYYLLDVTISYSCNCVLTVLADGPTVGVLTPTHPRIQTFPAIQALWVTHCYEMIRIIYYDFLSEFFFYLQNCALYVSNIATYALIHYTNTPMQYTAIFHGFKNVNFQMKTIIFFFLFFFFCSKTLIVGTH